MEFKETRPLPSEIDTLDAAEGFLGALASLLEPGLGENIGGVQWTHGDKSGVDWMTDVYLPDGTNVLLVIRFPDRTITLRVDTAPIFKRFSEPGIWVDVGLVGTAVIGIGVGLLTWSIIWGVATTLGIVGIWTAIDIAKQTRDERVAAARPIDEELWRKRLTDALDGARTTTASTTLPAKDEPG